MTKNNDKKYQKLALSILFDAMGYVSFILPFFDVIWAPAAGLLMTKMYKGRSGKIAGWITFIEEALPWLDVVPTFTLMWLYTYVYKGEKADQIIEV